MNKHKDSKPIYEKCLNPACENIVDRWPHHLKDDSRKYCCRTCCNAVSKPSKYGPEEKQLIMEFHKTHAPAHFAAHMGVTPSAVRKLMSLMRLDGYDIPREKGGTEVKWKIGDTKIRTDRGRQYTQVLTEAGWRAAPRPKRENAPKKPKSLANVTSAVRRPAIVKKTHRAEKILPVKNIAVYINAKTTAYVSSPDQVQKARDKYAHLNKNIYTCP